MPNQLPEGFVLDSPANAAGGVQSPPKGFVLDPQPNVASEASGTPQISLPAGMTEADIQSNRESAMKAALDTPGRRAYEARLAEGQEKGYYSTPEEDPLGARRPMRFSPSEGLTKAFGSPYATKDTESAPEAIQIGSGKSFMNWRDTKRGMAFVMGMSPEERIQALSEMDPQATFRKDEMGNTFVKFGNGKEGVLNKPGFSREDAYRIASDIAKFAPAARVAGMGSNIFYKSVLGALASGTTSAISEGGQKALGGNFDNENVVIDTIMGGGSELVGPFLKWASQKITPEGRQALRNAKTLKDLVAAGLDRKDIGNLAKEYGVALKEAAAMNIEMPLAAQIFGHEGSSGFQRPLARLIEGARMDDALARDFTKHLERSADSLSGAIKNTMYRFGGTDVRKALETARTTAQDLIKGKVNVRKGFANIMYDEAFSGAPKIDLGPLRLDVDEIIRGTAPNTAARRKAEAIKAMLTTDEYGSALQRRARMAEEAARSPVLDARGNPIPPNLGPMPKREMDPKILQEVNWELRDIMRMKPDDTLTNAAIRRASQIEEKITEALNGATSGKYSAADAKFAELSRVINELKQGMVGDAASKSDTTLKNLVTSVFNPRPEQAALSKKFMDLLRSQNKAAADDLYSSYFLSKLGNLDDNARPSDIYKAVFGKGEDQANMILQLAPDERTAMNLATIRKHLEIASRGEEIAIGKSAMEIAKAEERGGFAGVMGKMLTPHYSGRRFAESISTKNRGRLMFMAAQNDSWMRELRKIVRMDPTNPELENMIDSFFGRMMARAQLRNYGETLSRAGAQAAEDQINQNDQNQQ